MQAFPGADAAAEYLQFAEQLADAARAQTLPRFRAPLAVENKAFGGGFDPVTAADRAAEAAMRTLIEAVYPNHAIEGEEAGSTGGDSRWRWVLDPIDGTRAYLAGLPTWGTLIGLLDGDRPVIGLIDLPYLDERYRGWPGGADVTDRLGRRRLQVRDCPRLTEARLSTTDPAILSAAELGAFEMVRATARLTRLGLDCTGYAAVAAGGLDLVIESGLKPYDIAGVIPVVEGAGGLVRNWRGGTAWRGGQVVAAANAAILEEALVVLRRSALAAP